VSTPLAVSGTVQNPTLFPDQGPRWPVPPRDTRCWVRSGHHHRHEAAQITERPVRQEARKKNSRSKNAPANANPADASKTGSAKNRRAKGGSGRQIGVCDSATCRAASTKPMRNPSATLSDQPITRAMASAT